MGKRKLDEIDYLVIWESLGRLEWKKAIKVLNNIVDMLDKLAYLGVSGLKQAPTYVYLLML